MRSNQHAARPGQGRARPGDGEQARPGKPGRARQRAIRAHAAATGVPYSVAARHLDVAALRPGETLASCGRTIYPAALGGGIRWSLAARASRSHAERVRDARQAATLPDGRARHLARRFPPAEAPAGSGAGALYGGDQCPEILAMLYLTAARRLPGVVPGAAHLDWLAGLGEDSAIDLACCQLDRAARALLASEQPSPGLSPQLSPQPSPQPSAQPCAQVQGAGQILDALLAGTDGGHAPGTQVRLLVPGLLGRHGTVAGLLWGPAGPPQAYQVHVRGGSGITAAPGELIVLAGQESDVSLAQRRS